MLNEKYLELFNSLKEMISEDRLIHDDLRTLAYGTDASFYRLTPKLVVKARNEGEISFILRHCSRLAIPYTFRAAGTSLSGQAITDSVLISVYGAWKGYSISEDASKITLQPGLTGAQANMLLLPYGRKIGPDPASINSAMIGGIAANNASGMCCGTSQNSYKTLASMRIILSDGTLLDTADDTSRREFTRTHTDMIERLCRLSAKAKANEALRGRIERKFSMKNTTGYSLNALIDFDDPIDILQHLMIGSEGTLGFISSVTYNTVPEYTCKATSLILFPDTKAACQAVLILKQMNADAVEFMDRASLRSVEGKEGMPDYIAAPGPDAAALLVEFRAETAELLSEKLQNATEALSVVQTLRPVVFTEDAKEYKQLWDIRKGLFPSIGAMRKTGTTVIIEDVAFPLDRLAEATLELQELFKKHGYYDAIIYGHALEGNWHFVFKQDFNSQQEITRYRNFMDDVTSLVVNKYDGSLKAEHGTGRNMAPFVEFEWGSEAYALMMEIKEIFDPQSILNPGVIINHDHHAHLKNLKPMPAAHQIVDKCIECGFCEVNCPSRELTLTPRQRIVVWREISRLKSTGKEPFMLASLMDKYDYYADETCATDGLCAMACPVEINTGNLIKDIRRSNVSPTADAVADVLANHMDLVTEGMRFGLNALNAVHSLIGTRAMEAVTHLARKASFNALPGWNRQMPKGADKVRQHGPEVIEGEVIPHGRPKVVYFPSCINRAMGLSKFSHYKDSLATRTAALLSKAGYEIIYPEGLDNLCCGMAFASKGFKKQGDRKTTELLLALSNASENGKYPVLFDMSPCLYRTREFIGHETKGNAIKIYEPVEFIYEFLMDRLVFTKKNKTVTVHSTCSSTKMGLAEKLKKVAEACAENVIVPKDTGCCGFAGDRGFSYPELNESALKYLKPELTPECSEGYSTSKTCEIGLSLHSGIQYDSIVYLVDECTMRKY